MSSQPILRLYLAHRSWSEGLLADLLPYIEPLGGHLLMPPSGSIVTLLYRDHELTQWGGRLELLTRLLPWVRQYGVSLYAPHPQASETIAHVLADLDGTLIRDELLIRLANHLGLAMDFERLTQRSMSGELDFIESFCLRTSMLAGVHRQQLIQVAQMAETSEGLEQLLSSLRSRHIGLDIVTSNYEVFCQVLAPRWGCERYHASRPEWRQDCLTGHFQADGLIDGSAKAARSQAIAREIGVSTMELMAIGDGANDLPMLACCGHACLYAGNANVAEPSLPITILLDLLDQHNGTRDLSLEP